MNSERKSSKRMMNRKRFRDASAKIVRQVSSLPDKRNYSFRKRIDTQKLSSEGGEKVGVKICEPIYATENNFKNPLSYFESLWDEKRESSGVLKIIPPAKWKKINNYIFETFCLPKFVESQKKLDTRIQVLNQMLKGKKFQFLRNMSFSEYKDFSDKSFNSLYSNRKEKITPEIIEKDFWKFCHSKEEVETRYAADVSYSTFLNKKDFGNIFSYLKENGTWNLSSIHTEKDSLFQFLTKEPSSHISGLTIPWVYFGMLFSTFCWHVEDLYLYSLNYMHYGKSKIWYSIPHNEKENLDEFIKRKKLSFNIEDPNILHKLILLIDPLELVEEGITVYKAVQNPGEIIFTLPKGFHAGFSTGFNISEAVNLATNKWLKFGMEACNQYTNEFSKVPVFPLEWLIYKNKKNIKETEFSSEEDRKKILILFNELVEKENLKRKNLENYLKKNKISYEIYPMNEKENYSKNECHICPNYGYLSFLKCSLCNKINCSNHPEILCGCKDSCYLIFLRDLTH